MNKPFITILLQVQTMRQSWPNMLGIQSRRQKYKVKPLWKKAFIKQLESQGYEYFKMADEASFIKTSDNNWKS